MLSTASTSREQHSEGLKRCGSESPPASGRIQAGQKSSLGLFVPVFLVGGISPDAPCPPDCEKQKLGPSFFCAGCLEFHPIGQHRIDRSKPPVPENPEDRTLRLIREWEDILGDGEDLDARTASEIRGRIAVLKESLEDITVKPTTFAPEAPGGTGNLKAKSFWIVDGLDFRVQAHTKGEAVQAFAAALRRRGETGRFSVSISNPRRVK